MEMLATPKTLTEAIRYYSNPQTCVNAVALMRWKDGSPVCPKCNAEQGYSESLLAEDADALEVLFMPQAI